MKFSSFLLIAILLHAVTLVASAEENDEVNLVKRARTKKRHTNQLKDHWFADGGVVIPHPNADEGNGDDSHLQTSPITAQAGSSHDLQEEMTAFSGIPESFYHLSDSSVERQPSTEDSSRSSQDWEPEDPFLGHSSSAESEGWNTQGTSSASYSSEGWDPRRARQPASSTARTRASLSKASTTPEPFQYKEGSSSKAVTNSARRQGASDSSALVHTSGAKEQTNAIGRFTSSEEQWPPDGPRKTERVERMPRTENPKAREESERALEVYRESVAAGTPEEEAQTTFADKIFSICKELRKEIPHKSYQPCFQLLRVERKILSESHREAFKKKANNERKINFRENKKAEHGEKHGLTLKENNKGNSQGSQFLGRKKKVASWKSSSPNIQEDSSPFEPVERTHEELDDHGHEQMDRSGKSGQKRPRTEFGHGGEASPEESISPTVESSDVRSAFELSNSDERGPTKKERGPTKKERRPTKKERRPTKEERKPNKRFSVELDAIVRSVVDNFFRRTPQRKVHDQVQKRRLATAIFDALKNFRQQILDSDASQVGQRFFVLGDLDKRLIDKKVFSNLERTSNGGNGLSTELLEI
ncbi:hypothetical protein FA10DRAFT_290063 [Acaromyces ingoldii]|uniref:Uncharacterized protein n=1 Tax=Acaromyces ingoldii TaxID=215250 RepID=A0A316YXX6_9BASI|nr:hypothetical protein FA10DRAFT_290063 [Acaromyces ingoldii]PWN92933.1 hypothetical protein FA10DRAFT_290063 [Acaromyces ingoldii]